MSVRDQVLTASVQRRLTDAERVIDAVYLWRRHRLMVPFALAAGLVVGGLSAMVGFGGWGPSVAIGAAAAAMAVLASSDYRVLARTDRGLIAMPASRFRQAAIGEPERLPAGTEIECGTDLFVLVEWTIDGRSYTVAKRAQAAMTRIATGDEPA